MQPPLPLNPTPADNQKDNRKDNQAKKSGGLPLPVVLGGALVLALIGVAALVFIVHQTRSDVARLERERVKLVEEQTRAAIDQERAAQAAKLAQARTQQEKLLLTARNATNSLARLLAGGNQLRTEAEALKTSEPGRLIAQHPDLVDQARRFYETGLAQLPIDAEIINRLEAMRRVEQQLLGAAGSIFEPPADMVASTQEARVWADQGLASLTERQKMLASLISQSKIKVTTKPLSTHSPTLDKAVQELSASEAAFREILIVEQTGAAKTNVAEGIAMAEAVKVAQAGKAAIAKLKQQVTDLQEELQRQQEQAEASNQLRNASARVERQNTLDEAQRVALRKQAAEPAVQAKLAPFTTPGYWTPKGVTYKLQPHSLSKLRSWGALGQSTGGLQELVDIAWDKRDKVRPRWDLPGNSHLWRKLPEKQAQFAEAQNLLIELGPVLVEMELLLP